MTGSQEGRFADVDFAVTDHLQTLETWAVLARQSHTQVRDVIATAQLFSSAVLVPVCGNAVQKRGTVGVDPDGFMRQKAAFRFEPFEDVRRVTIVGWLPEHHRDPVEITAVCGDRLVASRFKAGAQFTLELDVCLIAYAEQLMAIELSSSFQPSSTTGSTDSRHLGCILLRVIFR